MRLLYYAPAGRGSLADHATEPAGAPAQLGTEVQMLEAVTEILGARKTTTSDSRQQ